MYVIEVNKWDIHARHFYSTGIEYFLLKTENLLSETYLKFSNWNVKSVSFVQIYATPILINICKSRIVLQNTASAKIRKQKIHVC
jgi:hypothetical protein